MVFKSGLGILDSQFYGQGLVCEAEGGGRLDTLIHKARHFDTQILM